MEREARLINETLSTFVPHSHTNVCNIILCMVVRGARSHCLKHAAVPKMPSTNLKCYLIPGFSEPVLQQTHNTTQGLHSDPRLSIQHYCSTRAAMLQQTQSNRTAIPQQYRSNLKTHSNLQTIPRESYDNLAAIPEQSLGNSRVIPHKYCSRAKAAP